MSCRVAVIFENRQRPETTGFYCRRGLAELVQKGQLLDMEHFLPEEFEQIPAELFDLFLWIDDGYEHAGPVTKQGKPAAWWVIDTHLKPAWSTQRGRAFDFLFCAQQSGVSLFAQHESAQVHWLPLACDPVLHVPPVTAAKRWDFSFVGHRHAPRRHELLRQLEQSFPENFVGNCYFQEMARVYQQSRVVFNCSVNQDLNMRVFEALAAGSLLLTDRIPGSGIDQLFEEGRDYLAYDTAAELHSQLEWALQHPEETQRLAEQAQQKVLSQHTYRQRMLQVIEAVKLFPLSTPPAEKVCLSRESLQNKPLGYFEQSRPEILALIPPTARRVLDIGCGAGGLGAALKQRQKCIVVGVELEPVQAEQARHRLDQVLQGEIETVLPELLQGEPFDCLVCADVLEHLRNPETVLKQLRQGLQDGGTLVTSLPNVQHHSVLQSLLRGNWTYESAGLLDQDHVRFFTRTEIEKLLFRCGFAVEQIQVTRCGADPEFSEGQLQLGEITISGLSPQNQADCLAYQWLTTAQKRPQQAFGLTSIILVTFNQLEYTRLCLDSLRQRTDEAYELIIIDNGSTDGTREFLRGLENVHVVLNTENRGFPAAVNQGLEFAQGNNLLLLNNDTVVTTGWLTRLLQALYHSERCGIVGPCSNQVSGPQQIPVTYRALNELDGFAWNHGTAHGGQFVELERLVGFCLLFRREVLEQIGEFDTRFGVGCFEDDDYCRRARQAGFQTGVAVDAFVHHFGSRSFVGAGVDLGHLLQTNQKLYEQKWNHSDTPPTTSTEPQRLPRPKYWFHRTEQGLRLVPNTVRLSGCLIVRDNERTIRPCLESLRPWVDELVVVDTGSQDKTPEIARELGARVFHWPWRDDFAAARNESFRHALGEWIFWMDSDDEISAECGQKLRELAEGSHEPQTLGYVIQVHCLGETSHDVTAVDHIKLIRNRPDLQFEFRIHEQILPAIRRAGGEVGWTDIYVVHSGSDPQPAARARKVERDLRLLERESQERPNHPFVLFNLGMTYAEIQDHGTAVDYLQKCLKVSADGESHVRKAYALLISSLQALDEQETALNTARQALELFPEDQELLFRLAMLLHAAGELEEAIQRYQQILQQTPARQFSSIDLGIANIKTRHNLAMVYEDLQNWEAALEQWQAILQLRPDYPSALRSLTRLLAITQSLDVAREFVDQTLSKPDQAPLKLELQAELHLQAGEHEEAMELLQTGIAQFPESTELLHQYCRLQFEAFDVSESIPWLQRLSHLEPDNPSVWLNLATAHYANQQPGQALTLVEKSLKLRPQHPAARELLRQLQQQPVLINN